MPVVSLYRGGGWGWQKAKGKEVRISKYKINLSQGRKYSIQGVQSVIS